jgi:LysR family glycine cleavage system transcriptional activator
MNESVSFMGPAMRHLPSLVALRAFEAAATRQSFKLAAVDLGVTPTAVSHQIRQLESELGQRLFIRRPRAVALTDAGRALFHDLRQGFERIESAVERLRGGDRNRIATLSASAAVAERLLLPRAVAFRAAHPGWELRLHVAERPGDLTCGEADAAICGGAETCAGLVAFPLVVDRFAPVCSPHVAVRRPRHLATATLLHCPSAPSWRRWLEERGKGRFDPDAGLTCDDQDAAIRAAVAGRGVALASLALAASELASGALIQPFGPALEGQRYDVVVPPGAGDRPAVAVLTDWLLAEFSAEREIAAKDGDTASPAQSPKG